MTEKRHLNVIASSSSDDGLPSRSGSQWILLGSLLVLALWLPLGMAGLWLSRWTAEGVGYFTSSQDGRIERLVSLVPILGSFVLAAFLGAGAVARFGPRRDLGPAAAAGGLGAVFVCSLAAAAGALRPWLLGVAAYGSMTSIGVLSGAWGGRWGRRLRNAASVTSLGQARVTTKLPTLGQ